MGGLPEGHRARSLSLRGPRPQTLPRGAALPQVSPLPRRPALALIHATRPQPSQSPTHFTLIQIHTHTCSHSQNLARVHHTHLTHTHRNLAPGVDPRHMYTVHAPHRVIS